MRPTIYIRRRRRSHFRPALITIVTAVVLLWGGVISEQWHQNRIAAQHTAISVSGTTRAGRPAVLRVVRPVYPFSIIRGGAYSPEELIGLLHSDPIAGSHYEIFHLDQVRAVRSTFAAPVYLSYRKDNLIFWTSHRVYLREGETLLTDGASYARARCGNRVSLVPQVPVAMAEPLPGLLDVPELPEAILTPLLQAAVEFDTVGEGLLAGQEDFTTPVSRRLEVDGMQGGLGILWPFISTVGKPYPLPEVQLPLTVSPVPLIPQPVPEPSGFILTGIIASAFALVRLRRAG